MQYDKIDPAVVEALRTSDQVDVFVNLYPPEGYGTTGVDLEEMKRSIAVTQDAVLAALEPTAYRNRVRFDAVPGLAGTVLGSRALDVLDQHDAVQSVTLDMGGVGHGS